MTGPVPWLALLYVALLPLGRSDLPLNAQWADLVLPLLALAVLKNRGLAGWVRSSDWPIAFYLGVTLLMAVISAEPSVGLTQFLKQLSVALVLLVFRQIGNDAPLARAMVKAFAITLAAAALVSFVAVFLRFPPWLLSLRLGGTEVLPFLGAVRRLRGGFLTPEMLGNAFLVAFTLTLALRGSAGKTARSRWTVVATVLFVGAFFTFSHSVAGFAVAAVFFVTGGIPSRAARALAWGVALSVVIVVNAASMFEPGPRTNDYGVGSVSLQWRGERVEGELSHYAGLKQVAWSAFVDHPLTGVGPGRFASETERAFREGRFRSRYRSKPPQCDLLGRLAECGILGGLSLLLLWAAWIRFGLSIPPRALVPRAAFAAVVGLLVNSVNADVMNFRFLWLAVGWMFSSWEGEAVDRSGG